MAELQHKTPRKPRRTNLRRLPGWHRTGEIFYAVGFLTEYWLICLGRKAAAAAHAARDAALYLIWLLLAPVLELHSAPRWPGRTRCGSWCHGLPPAPPG